MPTTIDHRHYQELARHPQLILFNSEMTTVGRFITLEGIDGAGKSTNIPYLGELLMERGIDAITTREPGGTQLGESIRAILLEHQGEIPISNDAELLLVFAARAQHLEEVITPALNSGQWVVCDRFTDATYAYQGGGRGIDAQRIQSIEEWVQGSLRPDLTLLFDLPVSKALDRVGQRSPADRFEREARKFLKLVSKSYQTRAKYDPKRIKIIDATAPESNVQLQIREIIDEIFEQQTL